MLHMEKTIKLQAIGNQIRKLRIEKQMTQVELAEKSKVNRNYIGLLERGKVNPTFLTLDSITRALGKSIKIK